MKESELDSLIESYLEDRLSDTEAAKLSVLIEESEEARERYWDLALVHGMLEQGLQSASLRAATGEEPVLPNLKTGNFFQWPRLSAAAAGILIGVFGASVVWAYKTPLTEKPAREVTELLFENFEDPSVSYSPRFPKEPGIWHGELSATIPKEGIEPMRGKYVARIAYVPGRKFSYARRILDLSELSPAELGTRREIEVQASFRGLDSGQPSQYQIRLGVFEEEPEAVRPIWNHEEILFDRVLHHVGENHTTEPAENEWHKMRVSVEIPPHARSLVISLAAADAGKVTEQSDHYLDAVRFRLIETPALPE